MLENRDYMREPEFGGSRARSVTVILVIINAVAFILQYTVLSRLEPYLTLSLDGLRHGFIWQLFTYQFLHAGFMHLLLNCFGLYVFGREVESVLGKKRFLALYLSSGVIGGLFQELVALVWPQYFGSAVVGASAGVFGVLSAYAIMNPERELTLLLFFILPVRMRAKTLLWINLIITAIGLSAPTSAAVAKMFGNMAHAAHLGGILTGLAFIRLREELQMNSRITYWLRLNSRKRQLRRAQAGKTPQWTGLGAEGQEDVPSGEFISREVDPILDKISAHGIQSLTERERKILEAARSKMARK